jgi:hypothetical protein
MIYNTLTLAQGCWLNLDFLHKLLGLGLKFFFKVEDHLIPSLINV